MTSKECEEQLNSLIEHFNNGGMDINATDIEAVKHLLLENQMQQDVITKYKSANLDQAVEIQQLKVTNESLTSLVNSCQKEIRKYKAVIEEVMEYVSETMQGLRLSWGMYSYIKRKILQILDKAKEVNK